MRTFLLLLVALPASAGTKITSQSLGNQLTVNGSTSPAQAQFDMAPSSSVPPGNFVLTVSSANKTTRLLFVTASGHVGSQGTTPTLSTCGTSTLDANATDQSGIVTVVGTLLTACTITFAVPYSSWEHCIAVSDSTAFVASVTTQGTSSIVISFTTGVNSGSFVYMCRGL